MAKKPTPHPLPSQLAWDGICSLRMARMHVKARLTEAEDALKDARRELQEYGVDDDQAPEYQAAAGRMCRALARRDAIKAKLKSLADTTDRAIEDAAKGQDKLFQELDAESLAADPTPREMYGGGEEDEDEDEPAASKGPAADPRPVGRVVGVGGGGRPGPVKPSAPEPALGSGVNQHLAVSVNELPCIEVTKGKLIRAGITTIAAAVAAIDAKKDLTELANLTVRQEENLHEAIGVYRAKHRQADLATTRAGA